MARPVILATRPQDYERLGLSPDIQPWEDGLRTDPSHHGHYEWWYFDSHLDDGAKLVVNFLTKDPSSPGTGLIPLVLIDLDLPDGRSLHKQAVFTPAQFTSSREACDVHIGSNHFSGDLHHYRIHASLEDITVDVELAGVTEPWRPGTGHIFYGRDEQGYFAWLPSVPYGAATVTYAVAGVVTETTGQGYHDHNWGNVALPSVVNHWYWGRGAVGPYTFITAYIVAEKAYAFTPVTVFMLAKDGKVIADDGTRVRFDASQVQVDTQTGKPVADLHSYRYADDAASYALSYARHDTLLRTKFIDGLRGWKRLAARAMGFNGAYLRFGGTITVDAKSAGQAGDHQRGDGIWELMYFGKVHAGQ